MIKKLLMTSLFITTLLAQGISYAHPAYENEQPHNSVRKPVSQNTDLPFDEYRISLRQSAEELRAQNRLVLRFSIGFSLFWVICSEVYKYYTTFETTSD